MNTDFSLTNSILPGSILGVLGGGQLGRMFTQVAQRMGYAVHVFCPENNSPAGSIAEFQTVADYTDFSALESFAGKVSAVTLEFENIPLESARFLENLLPLRPGSRALEVAQHRLREKNFLKESGISVAPFWSICSLQDIEHLRDQLAFPAVLKTAELGYDGRGQRKVENPAELRAAFEQLGSVECILEGFIDFDFEISLIAARNEAGQIEFIGPMRNRHANHILDVSSIERELDQQIQQQARNALSVVLQGLNYQGVLCVEFFVCGEHLLANEMAPRPHNSGHHSIEAYSSSQFELQLRALCNLPFMPVTLRSAAACANLLGDLWENGEPNFLSLLGEAGTYLHLYGKSEARPGRKMGHLTVLDDSGKSADRRATELRQRLLKS